MIVDAQTVQFLAVLGSAAAVALWWLPNPKCVCDRCGYHVNERRVEAAKQKELQHDVQHRGSGFGVGWPDKYDCSDINCERNKMNRPPL